MMIYDDLPIKNGDFPWLRQITRGYIGNYNNPDRGNDRFNAKRDFSKPIIRDHQVEWEVNLERWTLEFWDPQ